VTSLLERPPVGTSADNGNGGAPARKAMVRWAWRLFRREWRQQLLIVALIVVAVAATIVGATVATTTQAPADAGFGTAQNLATFQAPDPHLAAQIASLEHRVGRVDVIENQTVTVPGTINTYDLRAQDPHGPFGGPMLSLVSGRYPHTPGEVAVTSGVASIFHLTVGDEWRQDGTTRRVVGIVQNPLSLLDEFALVAPGQVHSPTQVTVLFDAPGGVASSLGPNIESRAGATPSNALNPETIVLALATIGMLLIALVAVGGFTVLAQRRLRSVGMIESLGATDQHVRLVVRANGVVVGVVGAVLGALLGIGVWLAYRPHAEATSHHLIGMFALPWTVIVVAVILAVVATYVAASRPARSITKVPIVAALAGRPAPPKPVHRSAVPGVLVAVVGFLLLGAAGSSHGNGSGSGELVLGLVALVVALILLAPLCLGPVAAVARRAPVAVRLATRDLARYRSRSGSALAAISLGVFIAVTICVVASSRYGNPLDYAGPNLASNQIVVYTPGGPAGPGNSGAGNPASSDSFSTLAASTQRLAHALGAEHVVELDSTSAGLQHTGAGRQFSGSVYVATPKLLKAFGISAAQVDPSADILTMRPGLDSVSGMQLVYGNYFSGKGPPGGGSQNAFPCPRSECVANPVIQSVAVLPSGTSAPNTVITEHAVHQLGLQSSPVGWLIETTKPLTAAQITAARQTASAAGLSIETKNDQPSSAEVVNWATLFGIALALGILAMTVGLIRSETASDLRILNATGASSFTRRTLTAATAGALGLLGAVIGTGAGYLGTIGFLRTNSLDGLSSLSYVPLRNLLLILVAMPIVAAVAGWLLAGRDRGLMTQQPLD
jgi:putative ABC transport system permease protein